MKSGAFLLFFLCGLGLSVCAQFEGHGLSVLGTHTALRDQGHSSLLYSGAGFGMGYRFESKSSQKPVYHSLNAAFFRNKISSDISLQRLESTQYNFQYTRWKRFGESSAFSWGWGLNAHHEFRFYPFLTNNNYGFEISEMLEVGVAYQSRFPLFSRQFPFRLGVQVPSIGIGLRPDYGGILPAAWVDLGKRAAALRMLHFASLHNLQSPHFFALLQLPFPSQPHIFYRFSWGNNQLSHSLATATQVLGIEIPLFGRR